MVIRFVISLALMAFALPAMAAEVILSRESRGVAIYIKMPFEDVPVLFGQPVEGLLNYDGATSFADLSRGTFDQAEALAQDVKFTINGQDAPFAAMSMMIHPEDNPVPFHDPLDALMAISVCGVPLPETPPANEDLVWIGGWYAPGTTDVTELTITFPDTGRDAMGVSLASFLARSGSARSTLSVEDGGTIRVEVPQGFARVLFGN
ncbi:MAG: hypothetical protein AAGF60_00960 [Pseudomonadota bacterium]